MKNICYEINGQIFIVHPAYNDRGASGMTPDQVLDFVLWKDIPSEAQNVKIIKATDLPADREFRDTWELKGEKVGENAVKKAAHIALRAAEAVKGV